MQFAGLRDSRGYLSKLVSYESANTLAETFTEGKTDYETDLENGRQSLPVILLAEGEAENDFEITESTRVGYADYPVRERSGIYVSKYVSVLAIEISVKM